MSAELKSCPFCGNKELLGPFVVNRTFRRIECPAPKGCGAFVEDITPDKTRNRWNRRESASIPTATREWDGNDRVGIYTTPVPDGFATHTFVFGMLDPEVQRALRSSQPSPKELTKAQALKFYNAGFAMAMEDKGPGFDAMWARSANE